MFPQGVEDKCTIQRFCPETMAKEGKDKAGPTVVA